MANTEWKILVIDDDEDDFIIARNMLQEAKGRRFNVHWANTYTAGKEALLSDHYHAVLVDYDLGLYSGIDLIREAKGREYPAPLILFTGRGSYEVDVEAMAAGATLYLTKGEVNPLLLERVIRYAIEIKQRENELREARKTAERELAERKRAEEALKVNTEALRASEQKFATLFQKAAYAAILGTLPDSTVVDINEAWEKLYGYTRDEAIGKSIPELSLVVDTEQRQLYLDELMQKGFVHDYEILIRVKSGELRTMRVNFDLLEIGGKQYTLNTSYDITAFKQAEEALRLSEEKYAKSFRSSPAAIAISTVAEGRFTEVNDRFTEIFGYTREEMIGHTSVELGLYPNPAERNEILRLLQEEGRFRDYETRMLNRHGEPRDLLFSGERVEMEGQDYMLALIMDITERKRVEQRILERESRLREFLESTHDTYFALDREWRFTYANHKFGELMGVDPQSVIGKNYWELYPQYLGTDIEQNYHKVMSERVPIHFRRQGIYTNILYETSLYPTQEGLAVFSIDRTEELRYQQQLEGERARLDTILQSLPVGVWIADADGKLIGKNGQADQIWAGEAPLVKQVSEYPVYESWDVATGDKLEPDEYPVAVALLTGQRVEKKELRIQRFDGSEGFVLVSAAPIEGSDGQLLGAVGINLDITDRKRTEQELQAAYARLRFFVDANIVGVTMYREDGTLIEANDYYLNLIGYSHEALDAGSLNWRSFTAAEYLPLDDQAMAAIKEGRFSPAYEKEYIHPDGSRVWVLIRRALLPDGTFAAFVVDMTERKQAEKALAETAEKLARSNRELEEFAFVASHDLQEPLRKIVMFGDSLRRRLCDPLDETAENYLTRMQDAAGRMQAMINGLLDLSRVSTQGREFLSLDLNQVVGEVVEDLEARIQAVNGQVRVELLPQVQGDALQIRALFQNLIGNALKFHQPGVPPIVRVWGTIVQSGGRPMAEIRVEDNGIGFEQGYADRIFQPFQRLHGKSEYEGTGLGLAICQKIVDRHQGTIAVKSAPGKGSTFTIQLPNAELYS